LRVIELHHLSYRQAWSEQERLHSEIVEGGEAAFVLVEHSPVITMGRRGETLGVTNLRASAEVLEQRGIEFVQTDRGGDITFHGPGQLVAYPIIKIIDFKLSVGAYVRLLQDVVIQTLSDFHITGQTDDAGIGVWVNLPPHHALGSGADLPRTLSKVCAFGVRVKQGVTLHGLALNVTTDLSYYDLIVPCGIADKSMTSMQQILGESCPPMAHVKARLAANLSLALEARRKSA